jgi:hypothetical protein
MVMSTPKSERAEHLGHAHCTGNYVSSFTMNLVIQPSDNFWRMAAKVSSDLRSPETIAQARGAMGMLAYVPDPTPDPAMNHTPTPTGWEKFMLEKAKSPSPYAQALSLSNLGAVSLPCHAQDLVWAQTSSPFGPVFSVNLIGHESGLRLATTWREGAAVCRGQVKEIEQVFEKVLRRLQDKDWDQFTFETLTSGL